MRTLTALLVLLFVSNITFAQKPATQDTTKKKVQKTTVTEPQAHITPESSGVKRSIGYKFSSSVTSGDPGNGMFTLDNRNPQVARYIFIDDRDVSGADQTKWYSTWDDPSGATGRGQAILADINGKVICIFNFTGVFTDENGYWKLPVEYVSGSSPVGGSVYYYVFERIANRNDSKLSNNQVRVSHEEIVNQEAKVVLAAETVAVTTAIVTTEAAALAQTNNQVQITHGNQTDQGNDGREVKEEKEIKEETQEKVGGQVNNDDQHNDEKEIKEEKQEANVTQGNQTIAVAASVVATEAVAEAQASNQTQITQGNQVNQGNQVSEAATVTTGAVVASQAAQSKPVTPPAQPAQTKPVTQTNPPAQTNPVAQTTQPTQSKPVAQTTPPTQSKPVAQTAQPTQAKPATQAAVTTAAVTTTAAQPAQKTEPVQQTQVAQSSQQVSANQPPPSKQYNQFPVVNNIFQSSSAGKGHRKWYRGIIELGYGLGLGDYGINNFRFNFINAVRIGEFSSIGLGIGYRRYFTGNDAAPYLVSNENQIPLFLDLRTSFSTRKLTPYLALGIGTSSGYQTAGTDKGLFMFNASGGIWYNVSPGFAVFAGIAYEMQKLEYSDSDPFANSYLKSAGSISLNIGISF
jgi:hypothetical protein